MGSYHAVQAIPGGFTDEPYLVVNIIAGRVEYLLGRVIEDGHNPLEGALTVTPGPGDLGKVLHFTWRLDE